MEILALLLLGLIAMLAIVPPIIRGKLEESPLVTAQTFQRSLQEMAHSIEGGPQRPAELGERIPATYPRRAVTVQSGKAGLPGRAPYRRTSAAVRRNRIMAALISISVLWGAATLFSGKMWCLILFAASTFLLVIYWALTIIVPRLVLFAPESVEHLSRPGEEPGRAHYPPRAPSRQRTRTMSM